MATQTPTAGDIDRLRERMQRMQDGVPRRALPTHPALAGLVQLRTGGSYEVDSATLALALMAGPSQAGEWCAVVGVPDFGAEAAAEAGVELSRTIVVPEPGEQWLEVTAALVDVVPLVVLRPPARVGEHVAEKLGARLRKRESALVALGPWPRCELRLSATEPQWDGVGLGHGHLRTRRLVVEARRGSAPPRRTALWFPADDGVLRRAPAPADVPGLHGPVAVRAAG
ncbi:hypothetical protein [Nocardioides sp. SYSU DS0663]|uniref:hypothetical protein n=1 Tax=Nocardioides sp. SYSU DS0663 TaxID=3416445 RepID=UPI003F4BC02D